MAKPDRADWIKASKRDPYTERLSPGDIAKIFIDKYGRKEVHVNKLDGFEFFIDTNYKHLIKNKGFRHAHEEFGVYLYGEYASGPYVEHLGR
jgi:hypothetical protein